MDSGRTQVAARVSHVASRAVIWQSGGADGAMVSARVKSATSAELSRWKRLLAVPSHVIGLREVLQLEDGDVRLVSDQPNLLSLSSYLQDHRSVDIRRLCTGVEPAARFRDTDVPASAQVLLGSDGNIRIAAVPWLQNPGAEGTTPLPDEEERLLEECVFSGEQRAPASGVLPLLEPTAHREIPRKTSRGQRVRKRRSGTRLRTKEGPGVPGMERPSEAELPPLDERLPITAPTPQLKISPLRWGQLAIASGITALAVTAWMAWRWSDTAALPCPSAAQAESELNSLLQVRAEGIMRADPQVLTEAETGSLYDSDADMIRDLSRTSTQLTDVHFESRGLADLQCTDEGWEATAIVEQSTFTRCAEQGCSQEDAQKLHLRIKVVRGKKGPLLTQAAPVAEPQSG